jgi:murein DD-endopeptidase MepM/ murein hydrolase activator NlpD
VKVGDRVKRGDKLCESGGVGFSPEPHLHFTAFRSKARSIHWSPYDRVGVVNADP